MEREKVITLRKEFLIRVFPNEDEEKINGWARMDFMASNWTCLPWRTFLEEKLLGRKIAYEDMSDLYPTKEVVVNGR